MQNQFGWFARWYSMYDDLMLKGGVETFFFVHLLSSQHTGAANSLE
jgi:hypothetical protein